MKDTFSKRYNLESENEKEITIRFDAPYDLRGAVLEIAYECGFQPSKLREIICRVLLTRPDTNNWSERPNIAHEVQSLIDGCEWYYVYDIIEEIAQQSSIRYTPEGKNVSEIFTKSINFYFKREGIGWLLENGKIIYRGDSDFQKIIEKTQESLSDKSLSTSANEIEQAHYALSRRPQTDITGAIQHSMAALECVVRQMTGQQSSTLGKLLNDNPDIFKEPLKKAVEKVWGYASEMGRHVREGREPSFADAEFVVGFSALCCRYVISKIGEK